MRFARENTLYENSLGDFWFWKQVLCSNEGLYCQRREVLH
jgi:hypothetical protein